MGNDEKILIVSAVSGSGHRVTAQALASLLRARRRVTIVPVHRILGVFDYIGELFYNFCLMHGKTRLVAPYHRLAKKLIRLYRPFLLAAIRRFFRTGRRDCRCIVSCVPWVNHYFIRALPHIPLVTVITDFCDSVTHPWIQHKKQHLICPTAKAERQARAFGLSDERIFRVSGNIISPEFYVDARGGAPKAVPAGGTLGAPAAAAAAGRGKAAALKRLGLDPQRKTALLFYGGYGPNFMEQLARAVDRWNLIIIWGSNPRRVEKPLCANIGFTHEVPHYMRLADLLVGKPGPGVVAEAVHCNLPVLVDAGRNSVLPQEHDVLEWILQSGVGGCFKSLAGFKGIMSRLGERELARWRENTASMSNNALFEAAAIIERIVDGN